MINMEDFDKLDIRIGTILEVKENKRARDPAYILTIDFGNDVGIKKTSAKLTQLYNEEKLVGRQVVCCVNLTPLYVGSVKSEVRILGTDSKQGIVLLDVAEKVENGDRVF